MSYLTPWKESELKAGLEYSVSPWADDDGCSKLHSISQALCHVSLVEPPYFSSGWSSHPSVFIANSQNDFAGPAAFKYE